jgi:MraZ protein
MTDIAYHFIGRYYHALEQKGRLSIPPSLRQNLGSEAILTRGLDGCLFLFPKNNWESVIQSTQNLPLTQKTARDWVRLLANNAQSVTCDAIGRILIPDFLRESAHLVKDIVIVGSIDRIEIWDQATYHAYLKVLEQNAETIAETITPSAPVKAIL